MKLSVVSPIYGAPEALEQLVDRLSKVLGSITKDYEIILVNDGCPKGSWDEIQRLVEIYPCIKGVNLSRNFGQHKAIAAGLYQVSGDFAVVMDCDLQDMPEEIPKLVGKAQEGYEVVFGRRVERKDNLWKKTSAKVYYSVFDYLTGFKTDHSIANFSVISRKVVDAYKDMPEQNRPYGYFINWLGFKRADVEIEHSERPEGKSSYTFFKLLEFAVNNVISETNKPLKIGVKFGFTMSLVSLIFACLLVLRWYYGSVVQGWTSVVVSIFFVSGLILAKLGLIGLYLGKVFDETKNRPIFVIAEIIESR
ncbi:glycosyltransferase family 2 protein [Vibrio cholerae]|uniref:glycosyltransferase family 2 protein n=1 Tax=Vibrio cholerae TaxID=666 RepID=UPI0004D8C45D|nr:glycosyltransferase family 2 protein [Vibrio cholerae]MDF4532310.1 glycosyltransferase family 2 protein [Vibrio parahaemolyticus]AKB04346.1 glycosyl transferase 2 family protein [Vibrio cholerae]EGQ7644566.1 glycosyltransferase family 2 protein [Vibrio cholerae]EGR2418616.1 glycosyltransferase [Vibrio cholerae]EJL6273779.1 glycosyltransferase family 2 protein [Vibrio cholerae]